MKNAAAWTPCARLRVALGPHRGRCHPPRVSRALHRIVPSYRNLFRLDRPAGQPDPLLLRGPDRPPDRGALLRGVPQPARGRGRCPGVPPVDQRPRTDPQRREVDRPSSTARPCTARSGARRCTRIEAIVKRRRGQPLGSLVLYRAAGDPSFRTRGRGTPAAGRVLPSRAGCRPGSGAFGGRFCRGDAAARLPEPGPARRN